MKKSYREMLKWVGSAVLYALTSILIITVNKSVLTIHRFPSVKFLAAFQLLITILVTHLCKMLNIVSYPDFSVSSVRNVMPLPILYMANMMLGLGSTQSLSIAMFTVLRRFTVLFVMIGEIVMLRKRFSIITMVTVLAMVSGVIVASVGDLAFELNAYMLIFSNNLCTAAYGLYVKKINDSKSLGKFGMMFYNSVVAFPLATSIWLISGEYDVVANYAGWQDPWFCFLFLSCSLIGYVLIYTSILCTTICGALTYNVVGVLKNTVMTYFGMWYGGGYIFSWVNFVGITISALGGVVYSAVSLSGVDERVGQRKDNTPVFKA